MFERVKENLLKHDTVDSFLNQQLRLLKKNYRKTIRGIIKIFTRLYKETYTSLSEK